MKRRLAFLTVLLSASRAALQGAPPDGAIFLGAEQAMTKPRKLPTELLMPVVFSDHMVLQRDMPALVRSWRAAWGKSALPFIYANKRNFTTAHRDALAMLPHAARAEYEGLSTINHPPDKAAYARRIVEQMEQLVYEPATL